MKINSVNQTSRDPFLIFGNDSRSTPTGFLWVIEPSTWTGIHRRDQLEVRRKCEQAFRAANGDNFIIHRLAHYFEYARIEFGKLIQK